MNKGPAPYKEILAVGTWAFNIGPYGTKPLDFETEVVPGIARAGFKGLALGGFNGYPNPDLLRTPDRIERVKELIAAHGLVIVEYAAPLWDNNIISGNEAYRANYQRQAKFAADMGTHIMRVDTNRSPTYDKGHSRKAMLAIIAKTIGEESRKAYDTYGVKTAIEFEPGFMFSKPSEFVKLLDMIPGDYVGALYDTSHGQTCAVVGARQADDKGNYIPVGQREVLDGGQVELIGMLEGRIIHAHVIDNDGTCHKIADKDGKPTDEDDTSTHHPLSKAGGKVDFENVLPKLRAANKSGALTLDFCFYDNAFDYVGADFTVLDQMMRGNFKRE